MKKEIYVVNCPTHIRFGDPMYFEHFEGQKLGRLVVDCNVPKNFVARVVLQEQPIEELPGEMLDTMTLYMAPGRTISTYMDGYCYKGQDVEQKEIGVDTATYLFEVDGRYEEFNTEGDGYWGESREFSRIWDGRSIIDAAVITVCMPESQGFEDMRRLVHYFFQGAQLLETGQNSQMGLQEPVQ
ncbi:hypothetical protein [Enterocloster bolteae]|uniref:hypothetical protein n=1 Tax=Enterocloster bolteae TaxID=208479 RepID=UPI002A82FD6C|nr:hypothetical protein [Enterocloster bolteae]